MTKVELSEFLDGVMLPAGRIILGSSDQEGWLAAACAALKRTLCREEARGDDTLTLLDHLIEGVLILDLTGHVIHANRAAHALFPGHESSMAGLTLEALGIRDETAIAYGTGLRGGPGGISPVIEIRGEPAGRTAFPMEMSIVSGQYRGERAIIAVIRDISAREQANEKLREAAAFFEIAQDAIMITDKRGRISAVNPAFSTMTGYSTREAIGQTPRLLHSGKQDGAFYAKLWDSLLTNGGWEGELLNRRKNGDLFIQYENISAIRDAQGRIVKFVAILSDITDKCRLEKEIEFRANYDLLTGLANRSLLIERLDQALKTSRRQKEPAAVLFIDLDHFKRVNDRLGHSVGDKLLQEAADRLRQCTRETDTVARQGGDEFVVVLTRIKGGDDAARVAEKIIAALAAPFQLDASIVSIGASIGIALAPDDGSDVDTLFRNADLAMYRAKSLGRNGYQFFEPQMTHSANERRRLFDEMQVALAEEEFELHYLPVFDLRTGLPVGAEALLRWNHPLRGMIEPGEFIALAEESGLIGEIDRWVLTTACSHLRRWCNRGLDLKMSIAVNLTGRKVPDNFTLDWLQAMLASHGLFARQLQLEINEKLLLEETQGSDRWVTDLRAQGFSIVLDDFGTGYSSLSRLNERPIDIIKVDRSLVAQMTQNPRSESMVRAILSLAHAFGTEVVAEGVETDAQAALLRAMGCHLVQGYHLSRPLPADQFGRWAIGQQVLAPVTPVT
jgi:diguanylate cyclase (GGDEF)-like protein/PAS domain S-box-containing protein